VKKLLVIPVLAAAFMGGSVTQADAHRASCHTAHTCPSDHATYKWKGMLCVKPSSPKFNASFKIKVRYANLPYRCKR
jgi:hypothetical protein